MQQLLIETDSVANANFLASFLRTVKSVKKVIIVPASGGTVNEPAEPYNWTNPSRPATDEEIDAMLDECEAEEGMLIEEARALTKKKIAEWKKKNGM